jgi:hypothetical protein
MRASKLGAVASGPKAAFARGAPMLEAIAGRGVAYVGEGELARICKIAHNLEEVYFGDAGVHPRTGAVPGILVDCSSPFVVNDEEDGLEQVVAHLQDLGHRAIGHIAGQQDTSTGYHQLEAFGRCCAARGMGDWRGRIAVSDAYTQAEGCRCMEELLSRGAAMTAVVATNDMLALGAIGALREALADEKRKAEAAEIMRTLIDKIELTPVCHEGKETLSITLHGDLAGILGLAVKAKGPLGESDPAVECTKLVAGAYNHRQFGLPPIQV